MKTSNYRIDYKEKNPYRILIIIAIILLLIIIFKPFSFIKKTLFVKALEYKSTHDPVYFNSLKVENKKLPMEGRIINSTNKGIDISPTTIPTEIRIIDIGVVVDIGYNETEKNYVKVRHVSENTKDVFFTYYSNLPDKPNLTNGEWVGSSTILYSGNNLNHLHFEVLDFDSNNLDPKGYINIE